MSNQATRTIYINGKEAQDTLKGLTELASRFRNEMRNAEEGSAAFQTALRGLAETQTVLAQRNKQVAESLRTPYPTDSIKGLTLSVAELRTKLEQTDRSSDAFNETLRELTQTENRLTEAQRQVAAAMRTPLPTGSIRELTQRVADLKNKWESATRGSIEYREAFRDWQQAQRTLNTHNTSLRGITQAYGGITQGLSGIAGYAAAAFSVNSLINFGKEALTVANNFEQTSIAYTTMLGSKKAADELQAQIIELAAKTPFELPQVQQATKQLLAYGFSAKEVIPNLTALGNIAAGVGQEKLPQLILAFGQVKAATKLTGNELRQFTEAGVPLLEELSKVMKKPVSEIQKMVSDGAIGFPIVQKALQGLTTEGGRFANLMEKQSQTLGGLYSTFKDTFTQNVLLPIGNGIAEYAKPALKSLTVTMEDMVKWFKQNSESIFTFGKAIIYATGVVLSYIVTVKAVAVYHRIAAAATAAYELVVLVMTNRLAAAAVAQRILNFVMSINPIGAVIALVWTLVAAYTLFTGVVTESVRIQRLLNDVNAEAIKSTVEQKLKLQDLLRVAKDEKRSKEDRIAAIKQLNALSPQYLGNLTLEKIGTQEATAAVNAYISALDKKAKKEAALQKRTELEKQLIDLDSGKTDTSASFLQTAGNAALALSGPIMFGTAQKMTSIQNAKESRQGIQHEIDAINKYAEENQIDYIEPNKTPNGDGLSKKDKKDIESDAKKLAKLRENLVNYQNDIKQLEDSEYKEELKTVEKYEKQIIEVKKLYRSKDAQVRIGAHALVKELEKLKNEELVALSEKHLKTLSDELDKQLNEQNNRRLTADEKESEQIAMKYDKQIKAALLVENSLEYADAKQRERAKQMRLQFEAQRDKEIAEARAMRRAEQEVKDTAENEAFFKKMEVLNKQYLDLLNIKPVVLGTNADTPEARIQAIRDASAMEIAELTKKFEDQIKLEGDASERVKALRQKLATLSTAINKKEAADSAEITKDSNEKRLKATADMYNALGSVAAAAGELFATEGGKQNAMQKALTLAQIAFDTAAAISSLTKHSESNPANGATFGIAGTIQFATGLARILTNIGRARKVLTEVKQKKDGGYTEVVGQDDRQTYKAQPIGAPNTGLLNYSSPVLLPSTTGQPILANEKGQEYFVSNASLKKPNINYLVRMIDNLERTGGGAVSVSQRKQGGYSTSTTAIPFSDPSVLMSLIERNTAVMEELNNHLQKGIKAHSVIGYEQVEDITKAQARITTIKG